MTTAEKLSKERKQKVANKVMANKAKLVKASGADELTNLSSLDCDETIYPRTCLLYTSPSPRDRTRSRMPSSA